MCFQFTCPLFQVLHTLKYDVMAGGNTMPEDDIYGNKLKYENFIARIPEIAKSSTRGKYYCKNPVNVKYFEQVIAHFEMKDISYIRRLRCLHILKVLTYLTEKELVECQREDINAMVRFSHTTHITPNSKKDFIKDLKCIWRILFPERDKEGRVDETITPYAVRHLTRTVDKSKEKLRNDRLTWQEFQQIVQFFADDIRMQAYLTLALESLGRPQEILYTRIKDYEFHDNFARVWISEHGKEGTGFLQCIDAYPFVMEWYQKHPLRTDPSTFFFINLGSRGQYEQLKNTNINRQLAHACKILGIQKNITCYSLKRNGVTFRRQRGDTDMQIQHAARWTSTKQLQMYDLSTQNDAFDIELKKRGLVTREENKPHAQTKPCQFCAYANGFTAEFCTNCKRPLNREKIGEIAGMHQMMQNNEMLQRLAKMEKMFENMAGIKNKATLSSLA